MSGLKVTFCQGIILNPWTPNKLYKTNRHAHQSVEKEISAWLDVTLPVSIPRSTRRPLQVLWMSSVRSAGEVKHRLLPQSEIPLTAGVTCRDEITAWLNQRLPICAKVLLIYPSGDAFPRYSFPMSRLIFFFPRVWQTAHWHRNLTAAMMWQDAGIKSGQEIKDILLHCDAPRMWGFAGYILELLDLNVFLFELTGVRKVLFEHDSFGLTGSQEMITLLIPWFTGKHPAFVIN